MKTSVRTSLDFLKEQVHTMVLGTPCSFLEEKPITALSNQKALYLLEKLLANQGLSKMVIKFVQEELKNPKLTHIEVQEILTGIVAAYACKENFAIQTVAILNEIADTLNIILRRMPEPQKGG